MLYCYQLQSKINITFESNLYGGKRSLETLPNVNIHDPSHDKKNLPIMSVTGSINQNVFKHLSNFRKITHNIKNGQIPSPDIKFIRSYN